MSTIDASSSSSSSSSSAVPVVKPKTRRDHLLKIEEQIQKRWEANKEFDCDAPNESNVVVPKFMCTFPYPYMNGRLHLGHAFTVSKAEFAAGYYRLKGRKVLFPFAFHCTGMPIQAAANKLKREYETGVYQNVINGTHNVSTVEPEPEETVAVPVPTETATNAASSSSTATTEEESKVKELGKFTGKKSKAVAKGTTGTVITQTEIMLKSDIPASDIPKFIDPTYWLKYFPPLGEQDLRKFGLHTDWRRSFITTDANPYYDSFITWQFNVLRKRDKIGFGKRPTIFSPLDGQACADHDRASGEGVGAQEYTLIKLRVQDIPATHKAAERLTVLKDLITAGRPVYLVAATLRPETMYGQTNCYLLPEGDYGAFDVNTPNKEVFICSERSALNMSYQSMAPVRGEPLCLGMFKGEDLLGLPLSAPYAQYSTVYTLPLLTISMKKGTGVVTSVPSDAPDDWAAYRDLQEKPKLREKYGLTEDMVKFDVVEIIEIPVPTKIGDQENVNLGRKAAVIACDILKIKSQNDKEKLVQAKDACYSAGFYHGVMLVGKYAGKKVAEAKPLVRADMLAEGLACSYWEPESLVMSRSGDECVVAELDQWYLKYGEEEWKNVVETWLHSGKFNTYTPQCLNMFEHVVSWLREWACSRSFGLGTKLPWDPQFVIESLSDSTIYMAYYTVAHYLHGGSLDGSKLGPFGIKPEQMTDAVWDYIFLDNVNYPTDCTIPQATLDILRNEFRYWYPMDLRVSGKDLINNHLTMSLYNHAAVWEQRDTETNRAIPRPDRLPQSFFCNGHVLVDGEKMSKSKGNFITLENAINEWSSDCTRMALAAAGDTIDDANFETKTADSSILRLTTEEDYIKEIFDAMKKGELRTLGGTDSSSSASTVSLSELENHSSLLFPDKLFLSRLNICIRDANTAYETMRFRDAIQFSFYEIQIARDNYRDVCTKLGVPAHEQVIRRYLEVQCILSAPICSHFAEYVWMDLLGKTTSVTRATWPEIGKIDQSLISISNYLEVALHEFRLSVLKQTQIRPKKAEKGFTAQPKPTHGNIFVADAWPEWQRKPLSVLANNWNPSVHGSSNNGFPEDIINQIKNEITKDKSLTPFMKKIMPLCANVIAKMKDRTELSAELQMKLPFDEYEVWSTNIEYVRKSLDIPNITIYRTSDPVLSGPNSKEYDANGRFKDVIPLDPYIYPYAPAGATTE